MFDPSQIIEKAPEIVTSTEGTWVGFLTLVVGAIASTFKMNSRLNDVESKLSALTTTVNELKEAVDSLPKFQPSEINMTQVQTLIHQSMAPIQDKVLEVREKIADLSGLVKSVAPRSRGGN